MLNLYNKVKYREGKLSVVGLDYTGLPLAINFTKKAKVEIY